MNDRRQVVRGWVADDKYVVAARRLIQSLGGDRQAAQNIGIGRATLSRLLAGQPLSKGTLAILKQRFSE